MIEFIDSFFYLTSFLLALNTINDLRSMKIDSRLNWLALGASLLFIAYQRSGVINIISFVIISIVLSYFFKRAMANGDTEAISWVVFALGSIEVKLVKFLIGLVFLIVLASGYRRLIKVESSRRAGYPYLFGAWLIALFW